MFESLANKSVGNRIAASIIKPPIVGVPFFCASPSKPRVLTSSPICLFLIRLIILPPNTIETNKEVMTAKAALNEMY